MQGLHVLAIVRHLSVKKMNFFAQMIFMDEIDLMFVMDVPLKSFVLHPLLIKMVSQYFVFNT